MVKNEQSSDACSIGAFVSPFIVTLEYLWMGTLMNVNEMLNANLILNRDTELGFAWPMCNWTSFLSFETVL